MIKRLNYTGRRKIPRSCVAIHVTRRDEQPPVFLVSLDLGGLELPLDAPVFLEAYRKMTLMRWNVGTIGNLATAGERELSEFGSPEGVLFRVRVTAPDGEHKGRQHAEADGISGAGPADLPQEGLLSVRGQDLDALAWKLDLEPRPTLLINRQLGDWRVMARHAAFTSLVLPAVLTDVLTQALIVDDHRDLEDEEDWRSLWLRFAHDLPGTGELPPPGDADAARLWIEDAVAAFARVKGLDREFLGFWEGELK